MGDMRDMWFESALLLYRLRSVPTELEEPAPFHAERPLQVFRGDKPDSQPRPIVLVWVLPDPVRPRGLSAHEQTEAWMHPPCIQAPFRLPVPLSSTYRP
jgi:hypothetical protein